MNLGVIVDLQLNWNKFIIDVTSKMTIFIAPPRDTGFYIINPLSLSARGSSSYVCGRHILTYKDEPRAETVKYI